MSNIKKRLDNLEAVRILPAVDSQKRARLIHEILHKHPDSHATRRILALLDIAQRRKEATQ